MTLSAMSYRPPRVSSSDSATVPGPMRPLARTLLLRKFPQVSGDRDVLQGMRRHCTTLRVAAPPAEVRLRVFTERAAYRPPQPQAAFTLSALRAALLLRRCTPSPSPFGRRRNVSEVTGFPVSESKII
jgi:hypothetical protein